MEEVECYLPEGESAAWREGRRRRRRRGEKN